MECWRDATKYRGQTRNVGFQSKYPPAEPGALDCEPLEAATGVADAAPKIRATIRWPVSAIG